MAHCSYVYVLTIERPLALYADILPDSSSNGGCYVVHLRVLSAEREKEALVQTGPF